MIIEWYLVLGSLLLLTKWKLLAIIGRRAVGLLILDKGLTILIQSSIPILMFLAIAYHKPQFGPWLLIGLLGYQMFSYNLILFRLCSIKNNSFPNIITSSLFACHRLKNLLVLLLAIIVFVGLLITMLQQVELWLFSLFGVNFLIKVLSTLITCVFFGIFIYFTYFVFILVIVEKYAIVEAFIVNYQIIKTLPLTLLTQLTILTIFPGPLVHKHLLPVHLVVYLWLLIGTSLSIIVYDVYKPSAST